MQHPYTVILTVSDVDRAALNKHAVRPREFALERIAVWSVTSRSSAENRGDFTRPHVHTPDHVVLGVSDVEAFVS